MVSYMHRFMLKNNIAVAIASLKLTHLCFLNSTHRYFSVNGGSKITSIKGLFENYGFSETQFSKLLEKYPFISSLNVDIAKSKLDFLHSYGFTSNDLCQILAADAYVIRRSLENSIKPSCEIFKGLPKDNRSAIVVVKRFPRTLKQDLRKSLVPNIELLRHYGLPYSRILAILKDQPWTLLNGKDRFKIFVEEIKEMGFDPGKSHFAGAIYIWSGLNKETQSESGIQCLLKRLKRWDVTVTQ